MSKTKEGSLLRVCNGGNKGFYLVEPSVFVNSPIHAELFTDSKKMLKAITKQNDYENFLGLEETHYESVAVKKVSKRMKSGVEVTVEFL